MKINHVLKIIGFTTFVFLTASCTNAPLKTSYSYILPANTTPSQIRDAIIEASINRGWELKEISNQEFEASLTRRDHIVTVRIPYSQDKFDINYVSSVNLDADPQEGTIHRNYARWVNNFKTDIVNLLVTRQQISGSK